MTISHIILFLISYYFFGILFKSYSLDDLATDVYKYSLKRSREDILESVRNKKKYNIRVMMDDEEEEGKKLSSEISDEIANLSRTYTDNNYAEKEIDNYIKETKKELFWLRIRNLLNIVSRELFHLIPLFVLVLTGNIFLSLIFSLSVMTLYALLTEYNIRDMIEKYYSEEEADKGIDMYYRIKIASFSISGQLPFYMVLLIGILTK